MKRNRFLMLVVEPVKQVHTFQKNISVMLHL